MLNYIKIGSVLAALSLGVTVGLEERSGSGQATADIGCEIGCSAKYLAEVALCRGVAQCLQEAEYQYAICRINCQWTPCAWGKTGPGDRVEEILAAATAPVPLSELRLRDEQAQTLYIRGANIGFQPSYEEGAGMRPQGPDQSFNLALAGGMAATRDVRSAPARGSAGTLIDPATPEKRSPRSV
jgi:hypothetical protein